MRAVHLLGVPLDLGGNRRVENVHAISDVVLEILGGIDHRFTDERVGSLRRRLRGVLGGEGGGSKGVFHPDVEPRRV